MPKKLPYMPWYTGDYLKDPAVSRCAAATRGIWMDALCAMHELDRAGELRGTAEQLARITRCLPAEFVQAAEELGDTNTAEVELRNGCYVMRNRRMFAEASARKSSAERQLRHRESKSNSKVTPLYEVDIETEFELFWEAFPKGRKKSKGTAREAFGKAVLKCEPARITAAARDYADSEAGRGEFVKMPATWLNQECWLDDPEAWKNRNGSGDAKPKEFKTIPPEEFKQYRDKEEFMIRPLHDPNKPGRYFGTLRNGRKVETFIERKT